MRMYIFRCRCTCTYMFVAHFSPHPRLKDLFPDQNGWASFFGGDSGTVKVAMRTLKYDGPVEEFTMATCLYLQAESISRGLEALKARTSEVRDIRARFFRKYSVHCCPGYVADVLWGTKDKP